MAAHLRPRTNRNPLARKRIVRGLLASMLAGLWFARTADAQQPVDLPPVINADLPNRIPDQYIVIFKPGIARDTVKLAQSTAETLGARVGYSYQSVLAGFSATIPVSLLQKVRELPGVAYLEADQVGTLNTVQAAPPAGLDRTSERLLPLDNRYTYSETGADVHVYVIDTGILATHTEFGGRVSGGTNTMSSSAGTSDCHGHGTHVAATIGGATFGIAKDVFLHPVRAGDCTNTFLAPVIAAVDWVTSNRVLPAVVNLSSGFGISPTLDTAIANSVASGVTYAVAAGNNNGDACNISPARAPAAITVGAIDPSNDTRASFSNFGSCVDLFAPGVNTLSAGISSNTATAVMSGTSMASPHVAGVAARYLETHPGASPASVWSALHSADDVATTPSWPGVVDPGAGSPNELLHYGSVNDGLDDGDPHITTVTGLHYDFQDGGEFVALSDGSGMQIQTRQTPVPTATWVSVNTAIAARVGAHRVTWQPSLSGVPSPSGLELRVDGAVTSLGSNGLDWGADGRVLLVGQGTLEIDFPEGTTLMVTPHWWANQSQWYLTVNVFHTTATQGLMGDIASRSWLESNFADTWRVTPKTSLFDYASDASTRTFTFRPFPKSKIPPINPDNLAMAERVCGKLRDKISNRSCVFDVAVTGDTIFLQGAMADRELQLGATQTALNANKASSNFGELVTLTAFVAKHKSGQGLPTGTIQFFIDDKDISGPIKLSEQGQASWSGALSESGMHRVQAKFYPDQGSVLPSSSADLLHDVEDASDDARGGL
jgi:subtilisin family serine protease